MALQQALKAVPEPRQGKGDDKRMHVEQDIPAPVGIEQRVVIHHEELGKELDAEEQSSVTDDKENDACYDTGDKYFFHGGLEELKIGNLGCKVVFSDVLPLKGPKTKQSHKACACKAVLEP